jgi:hypothetical protein
MNVRSHNLRKAAVISSFPVFLLLARFVRFDKLPTVCGFYLVTGYPCPTCGMTRSVMAIAHLNFHRAMQFNPLGFAFLGLFAVWWVNAMRETSIGHRTKLTLWVRARYGLLLVFGIAVLIIFGSTRIWLIHRQMMY